MILSHRHKFIYIKNRKVASTSTELFLQRFCGEEDVVTPDGPHPRPDDPLLPGAANWEGRYLAVREFADMTSPLDAARILRDFASRPKYYNHMRATSVRARVPRKIWNSYYKFCFERNPWDKCVSFYYYYGRNRDLPEFNEFYQNARRFGTLDQVFPSDWTRYADRDGIIVDDVLDFADLSSGLAKALNKIGISQAEIERHAIPKQKTEVRKGTPTIEPATDALIRRVFRREIAALPFCREPAL